MAETSCSALCFFSSIPFRVSPSGSTESFASSLFITNFHFNRISVTSSTDKRTHHRHVSVRFAARPSDSFNFFPWSNRDGDGDAQPGGAIEWVQEERITLFTVDGLIQIGGSVVPKRVASSDKQQGRLRNSQRFQRFKESNYMDPNQVLCLGALFDIAATNGLDMGRRLCILGFCRSIEMLSDVVEDTVLEHGGEIVAAEKASKGGLHEKLMMTVAVPYLWGVPPASETLHLAVQSGGGIVEKMYWQWDFA